MPRRLRINSIHLEGFGPHRATTLDLARGRIFNLCGPFGCGKSFVPEAIRWAIEGAATREVEYDPKIAKGPPAERTRVGLALQVDKDALEVWRTPAGSSHAKGDLYALLGIHEGSRTAKTDLTLLDICLHPQRFFSVPADARLRFLDRTFGDPLGLGSLEAAGVKDPETQAACLKSLKAGLADATKKRRDAERMAEAASVPRPEDELVTVSGKERRVSAFDLAALESMIAKKREERDALQRVGVVPQAPPPSEVAAAEKAVAAFADAVKRAEAEYRALVMGDSGKAAARAREEKDTLGALVITIKTTLAALEADPKKCEKCGNRANSRDIEAEQKSLVSVKDTLAAADRTLAVHASEEKRLKGNIANAQAQADAAGTALAGIRSRQEAAAKGGSPEALEAAKKADAVAAQIRAAEAVCVKVRAYHAATTAHENAEKRRLSLMEVAAEAKHAEEGIERLIKERGEGAIPRVQQKVRAIAERLDFPCELSGTGEVLVKGAPIEQASRGQRLYAGIALGAAVASLSGIRFLFIDDLPSVDSWARLRLFRVLRALTQGEEPDLEQVFLVTLADFARWCPKCQMKRVSEEDGRCGDCRKAGVDTKTRILPPAGPLVGVYRIMEFTGPGRVEEVL